MQFWGGGGERGQSCVISRQIKYDRKRVRQVPTECDSRQLGENTKTTFLFKISSGCILHITGVILPALPSLHGTLPSPAVTFEILHET